MFGSRLCSLLCPCTGLPASGAAGAWQQSAFCLCWRGGSAAREYSCRGSLRPCRPARCDSSPAVVCFSLKLHRRQHYCSHGVKRHTRLSTSLIQPDLHRMSTASRCWPHAASTHTQPACCCWVIWLHMAAAHWAVKAWPGQMSSFEYLYAGSSLTAAQLGNQVTMQARRAVADYYDGWLQSDDELAPLRTRNLCLRSQVRACLAH